MLLKLVPFKLDLKMKYMCKLFFSVHGGLISTLLCLAVKWNLNCKLALNATLIKLKVNSTELVLCTLHLKCSIKRKKHDIYLKLQILGMQKKLVTSETARAVKILWIYILKLGPLWLTIFHWVIILHLYVYLPQFLCKWFRYI